MMAELAIDNPVTTETIEPNTAQRRKSTGNLRIQSNGAKVSPRYLKPSASSCHDFCKYGTKHVSQTKARSPMPKRLAAMLDKSQDQDRSATVVQRKEKSVITSKPAPDLKNQMLDKCEVIKREVPASAKKVAVSSKQVSSPGEESNTPRKHARDLKPEPRQTKASSLLTPTYSSRRHSEIIIPKGMEAFQMNPMRHSSSGRNSETKISKEMLTSKMSKKNSVVPLVSPFRKPPMRRVLSANSGSYKSSLVPANVSPFPKLSVRRVLSANSLCNKRSLVPANVPPFPKPSVRRVLSANSRSYKNPREVSRPQSQQSVKKAGTEQHDDQNVPEKTLYVIEPEAENQTGRLPENGSLTSYSTACPPPPENENSRYAQNGFDTTEFCSFSSPTYESRDTRLTETEIHETLSSASSKSKRSNKSGLISGGSGTKTENQITDLKVQIKGRPRLGESVRSEHKDCSPEKLKFRRGMVVDVQAKNSSPRRLGFRQTELLNKNQSGKADTRGRSLRKIILEGKSNVTKTESVKVVLRHQDTDGTKGTRSLLNNVIEETASKLVKTRKSKVKALVGAFETVISLHDTKSQA